MNEQNLRARLEILDKLMASTHAAMTDLLKENHKLKSENLEIKIAIKNLQIKLEQERWKK